MKTLLSGGLDTVGLSQYRNAVASGQAGTSLNTVANSRYPDSRDSVGSTLAKHSTLGKQSVSRRVGILTVTHSESL